MNWGLVDVLLGPLAMAMPTTTSNNGTNRLLTPAGRVQWINCPHGFVMHQLALLFLLLLLVVMVVMLLLLNLMFSAKGATTKKNTL